MPSPLSDHIYDLVRKHIETGIPITGYDASQAELDRIEAVFKLYRAYREDPFVPPHTFLERICRRTKDQIVNDLRLFDFVKKNVSATTITQEDARLIADINIRKLFKNADATGDDHIRVEAMKQLGKWHNPDKEAAETDNQLPINAPVLFTDNIQEIAPDYERVMSPARRALLEKYNGKPDANTDLVERKAEEILAARQTDTPPQEAILGLPPLDSDEEITDTEDIPLI